MNGTAGREFLGLHPFFAPKNGWNIKQKFMSLFFYVHFFFLYLAGKRKETNQRKENRRLSKETVKCFIGNFSATSCCKNYLKTQLLLIKVLSGLRPSSLLKEQAYLQYHNEVVKPFCTFRRSSTAKEGNLLRLTLSEPCI